MKVMKKNALMGAAIAATVALMTNDVQAQIVNTTKVDLILRDVMGTTDPNTAGTGKDQNDAGNNNGRTDANGNPVDANGNPIENGASSGGPATTSIVRFDFTTPVAYRTAQRQETKGAINVMSSTTYNINVRAGEATFTYKGKSQIGQASTIVNANAIAVRVKSTAANANYSAPVTLTTTNQPVILRENATADRGFDVEYTIDEAQARNLVGKAEGDYSLLVYYSISGV